MKTMKPEELIKVCEWMQRTNPSAKMRDLGSMIEEKFGEIKWDSQSGWGEGVVSGEVRYHGEKIRACSSSCSSFEVVVLLAAQLVDVEIVATQSKNDPFTTNKG